MPDRAELEQQSGFSLLMSGARNAIKTCLSLKAGDTVTIICDEQSLKIAASLYKAAGENDVATHVVCLERHTTRPATTLPPAVVTALKQSTASIYTVQAMNDEQPHRIEMIKNLVPRHNLRHAHMINITEDAMMQGLNVDYRKVVRINKVMVRKLENATSIRITNKNGTDVTVTLDPAEPWYSSAGVIGAGEWQNLPNGEILTCPGSVDGTFYCDNLIPGLLPHDRFELGTKPLQIKLEKGVLKEIAGGPSELARNVTELVGNQNNNDRVGMFAIGTNIELLLAIGDPLQDMFLPGAYFSFGRHRNVEKNPPKWNSDTQYVFSARTTSVEVDGTVLIRDGRYEPEVIAEANGG